MEEGDESNFAMFYWNWKTILMSCFSPILPIFIVNEVMQSICNLGVRVLIWICLAKLTDVTYRFKICLVQKFTVCGRQKNSRLNVFVTDGKMH